MLNNFSTLLCFEGTSSLSQNLRGRNFKKRSTHTLIITTGISIWRTLNRFPTLQLSLKWQIFDRLVSLGCSSLAWKINQREKVCSSSQNEWIVDGKSTMLAKTYPSSSGQVGPWACGFDKGMKKKLSENQCATMKFCCLANDFFYSPRPMWQLFTQSSIIPQSRHLFCNLCISIRAL